MDNILNLARQAQMDQPTPQPPTENAQVMCVFDTNVPPMIYRFNSAKKGRKAYEDLVKAWRARSGWKYKWHEDNKKAPSQHFDMQADMFDGSIDLDRVISITIVEWPKRDKFVPR